MSMLTRQPSSRSLRREPGAWLEVGLMAGLAALVFALYPVHVEAVANGVGQAELWSAGLVLRALPV